MIGKNLVDCRDYAERLERETQALNVRIARLQLALACTIMVLTGLATLLLVAFLRSVANS